MAHLYAGNFPFTPHHPATLNIPQPSNSAPASDQQQAMASRLSALTDAPATTSATNNSEPLTVYRDPELLRQQDAIRRVDSIQNTFMQGGGVPPSSQQLQYQQMLQQLAYQQQSAPPAPNNGALQQQQWLRDLLASSGNSAPVAGHMEMENMLQMLRREQVQHQLEALQHQVMLQSGMLNNMPLSYLAILQQQQSGSASANLLANWPGANSTPHSSSSGFSQLHAGPANSAFSQTSEEQRQVSAGVTDTAHAVNLHFDQSLRSMQQAASLKAAHHSGKHAQLSSLKQESDAVPTGATPTHPSPTQLVVPNMPSPPSKCGGSDGASPVPGAKRPSSLSPEQSQAKRMCSVPEPGSTKLSYERSIRYQHTIEVVADEQYSVPANLLDHQHPALYAAALSEEQDMANSSAGLKLKNRWISMAVLEAGSHGAETGESQPERAESCSPHLLQSPEVGIQQGPCYERTPRLAKCRDCKQSLNGKNSKRDQCRFDGFRRVKHSVKGHQSTEGFLTTTDATEEDWALFQQAQDNSNYKMAKSTARYILHHISPEFLSLARHEMAALDSLPPTAVVYWRRLLKDVRELCDVCSTTLFNLHWFCSKCGFVVCLDCYQERKRCPTPERVCESPTEADAAAPCSPPSASTSVPGTASSLSPGATTSSRKKWVTCLSANRAKHDADKLLACSVIPRRALQQLLQLVERLQPEFEEQVHYRNGVVQAAETPSDPLSLLADCALQQPDSTRESDTTLLKDSPEAAPPELIDGVLYYSRFPVTSSNSLLPFQNQLAAGCPVVVSGQQRHLQQSWLPSAFAEGFGERCTPLVNCSTNLAVLGHKMKEFWGGFDHINDRICNNRGQPLVLKLKDWPSDTEFAKELPLHFEDVMRAMPMNCYTWPRGELNLSHYLPSRFNRPDLGPKLYNAYGGSSHPRNGSTNLHLDVCDAVNLLCYTSAPTDDGGAQEQEVRRYVLQNENISASQKRRVEAGEVPGALWQLFPSSATPALRSYLSQYAECKTQGPDPVHEQLCYVDDDMQRRLRESTGMTVWNIVQFTGDVIIIPAGCAHQVRNLHSCIKVACDFVCPERLAECMKLTREFQRLPDTYANHEDKLQVKNILYHTVKEAAASLNS